MAKKTTRTPRKTTRSRKPITRTKAALPTYVPTATGSENALTKPQVISELTRSPHGDLKEFLSVGLRAAKEDPDFFAHLIAWNHLKGQIRDAKVALPVIGMATTKESDYLENAVAHLADLTPRDFLRALNFAHEVKAPSRLTRRLVKRYLKDLEQDYFAWERAAIQHRNVMRELYARFSVKTGDKDSMVNAALFHNTAGGKFKVLRDLSTMTPEDAAAAIQKHKIPFLVAKGALGAKAKDPDVLLAIIQRMTPTELITNTKALERLGIRNVPALRAAFEEGLAKAAKSNKATLKTSKAAEALEDIDPVLSGKLKAVQEKQLDNLKGIEGDWLVLGDASGSMAAAIETARQVSGVLARMVRGKVYLVFFDNSPRYFDVTGKTLEEIQAITKGVRPGGSTSIGCGLQAIVDRNQTVDGIAVVTDGGENCTPYFYQAYQRYVQKFGNEPTVYSYAVSDRYGYNTAFENYCKSANIDVQRFDLKDVDYYSLPNLVQTMRIGRYSLLDEVLNVPLKIIDQVLKDTKGMEVIGHVRTAEAV